MIFDRPSSIELLKAVNHFLDDKIKSEVPAHLAFKLRIVDNVLNIVIREIELGQELSEDVTKDLKELIELDAANIDDLASLIKAEKIFLMSFVPVVSELMFTTYQFIHILTTCLWDLRKEISLILNITIAGLLVYLYFLPYHSNNKIKLVKH